ncbi:MAG: hypothetical protein U0869_11905 [Chloroflexota bacterium]
MTFRREGARRGARTRRGPGAWRGIAGTTLSMALLATLAPAHALAADTPAGAVTALLDALDGERFGAIDGLVCADQRNDAERRLDLAQVVADLPANVRGAAQRAIDVRVTRVDAQVVEEDGADAIVQLTGSIGASLDARVLRRALANAAAPTDLIDAGLWQDLLAERVADRMARLPAAAQLDEELSVVREGSEWRLCDDLGWGLELLDPSDVCGLLSPRELSLVSGLAFASSDPSDGGCQYATPKGSADPSSVRLWLEEGDLDLVEQAFPDGRSVTVAGFDGYAADGTVRIDLGGRVLVIQPALLGAGGGDPADLALSLAEVVVPRIAG